MMLSIRLALAGLAGSYVLASAPAAAEPHILEQVSTAEGRSFFPDGAADGRCGDVKSSAGLSPPLDEFSGRRNTVIPLDLDCVISLRSTRDSRRSQLISQYLLLAGMIIGNKPEPEWFCSLLSLIDLRGAKDARFPDAFYLAATINLYLKRFDQVALHAGTAVDLGLNEAQSLVDWAIREQISGDVAAPACQQMKK